MLREKLPARRRAFALLFAVVFLGPHKKLPRGGARMCDDEREAQLFFPQHIIEGLLNSRRRVSDRPSWILITKTPARKPTNIAIDIVCLFPEQEGGL